MGKSLAKLVQDAKHSLAHLALELLVATTHDSIEVVVQLVFCLELADATRHIDEVVFRAVDVDTALKHAQTCVATGCSLVAVFDLVLYFDAENGRLQAREH